ncbi:prephenate dehydrogenase dimerization domain-containing protein [Mycobacteroides abscessus]|uniref:prephenate dehydrogenase dimerization domain-containing protein n=1 Tax=Mycobacteroides abscessus TaxID=36809 RepID=UPI0009A89506|nr:prephenate dehydrogenase dimerization domain-containing protein [Mycobacteroides abscessus]SKT93888.1 T-protein [Mycobacteroides abscessus subsp. massiliense]SKU18889.1 T-protein [Mycobacteroides abscessus subsp. massiliense]
MSVLENAIVVGGAGAVGTMFANLLTADGVATTVVDLPGTSNHALDPRCRVLEGDILRLEPRLRAALSDADLVLLALPEAVACGAIPVIAPLVKPAALLADTLSVKATVARTWISVGADVEALSVNPMFAPSLGARGRPIAAVVLRDGPRIQALVKMMQNWGANVVLMDSDEHDTMTAAVQALTHASIIGFGLALRAIGIAPAQLVRVAPPPFQAMLALLARIADGTSEVYWEIQDANPYASAAREALTTGLKKLNDVMALGEPSFTEMLAEIADHVGPTLPEYREHCHVMFQSLGATHSGREKG